MALIQGNSITYTEGTWTPTLTFATPGNLAVGYTVQIGFYTRVGNLVTAGFLVTTSSFTHTTASGAVQITGLPFTTANVSNQNVYGPAFWQGITKASYTNVMCRIAANSNIIDFGIAGSGQTGTLVAAADMPTGGSVVLHGTLAFKV